jgi:type II secretory pathway pseudopilin PulG
MYKQKGFTLVEGLLIVLILSVVGFAGYTVWNNQQNKNISSDEPTKTENRDEDSLNEEQVETDIAGNLFCGATYSADYPDNWQIFYKDTEKTNVDCLIQSYSDDNPNIPPQGPYLDELSINFFTSETTKSLAEIKEDNTTKIGIQGDETYPPTIQNVEDAKVGQYNAVYSVIKDGHLGYLYDSYKFVVDGTLYTILATPSNSNLQADLDTFISSLIVL